jgi:hypothetical protein
VSAGFQPALEAAGILPAIEKYVVESVSRRFYYYRHTFHTVVRLLGFAELFAYREYQSSLDGNWIICWRNSFDLVFPLVLKEIEE